MSDSNYFKDFDVWNARKKWLDARGKLRAVRPGEVYWLSVGVNVGAEISGKGEGFVRPVLVIKRVNQHTFVGVPFTTKPHDSRPDYVKFSFNGRVNYAVLNQIRAFSTKRVSLLAGRLGTEAFRHICFRLRCYLGI